MIETFKVLKANRDSFLIDYPEWEKLNEGLRCYALACQQMLKMMPQNIYTMNCCEPCQKNLTNLQERQAKLRTVVELAREEVLPYEGGRMSKTKEERRKEAREEYKKIIDLSYKEFWKVTEPARKEYLKKCAEINAEKEGKDDEF